MKLRALLLPLVGIAAAATAYVYTQTREREATGVTEPPIALASHDARSTVGQDADVEAFQSPPAPGAPLRVDLTYGIAQYYMSPIEPDGGDRDVAPRVEELSGGAANYDPWLSRAARELAVQGAMLGVNPPEPVLSFILRSAGAPEGSVAQMLVEVRGESQDAVDDAIASALEAAPKGAGTLVVGVGEAAVESGDYERRLVVISARRNYTLAPTTRRLDVGETWEISGVAPAGFRDANASVLYPGGSIEVIPVEMHGREFFVAVPAGNRAGTVWASIDGLGEEGPGKLLQVQAEVGRDLPRTIEVATPKAEDFAVLEDAEAFALDRLNADRLAQGLETLSLDEALSAVARAHSEDMRDHGYFAHRSPSTGLAGNRLELARYAATSHGENLAFNDSITEAQSSLMESVGHRRNIVSPGFSHVGIGLARSESPGGGDAWHLTQVFARPVQELDPYQAAAEVLAAINEQRIAAGADALRMTEELVAIAAEGCEDALGDALANIPPRIAPRASRAVGGRVVVSAHAFYDFETLDVSELGMDADFEEVGLALLRDPEDLQGRTILVLVIAQRG